MLAIQEGVQEDVNKSSGGKGQISSMCSWDRIFIISRGAQPHLLACINPTHTSCNTRAHPVLFDLN